MSEKESVLHQTRRGFIKRTVTGMAVGVGAAALGMGIPEAAAQTAGSDWAGEADVVVVGSGAAGCASAIAAHEAGAKVLILEKAPKSFFGGNSSMSGGNFYVPPSEKYYENLMTLSAGRAEETAAKTLADGAEPSVRWLNRVGIRLSWSEQTGYAAGPEKGKGVMEDMLKVLQSKGIEVLFGTKAERLLQDDTQRVIGVQVAAQSGRMNLRAVRAVVLATGGYLGNEEMMVRYIGPQATAIVDLGLRHIAGDGHRMAWELGACLLNMGDCRLAPVVPESNVSVNNWYPHGIIVNKECQRFIDEAGALKGFSHLGSALLKQTDGTAYVILDEKWKTRVPASSQNLFSKRSGRLTEADTIEELAEKLGLYPVSLNRTIGQFNAAVKDGMALDLYPPKTGDAVRLEKPKFYGIPLVNSSTLSFGGLRINNKALVVNLEGDVIPRLYAAGILVGGIYYKNYKSGSGLTSGVAFGRLAGMHAASEKPIV